MKPARNEPCSCGSGKKFKHCCGVPALTPVPPGAQGEGAELIRMLHEGRLSETEALALAQLRAHPEAGIVWKVLSVAQMRQGRLREALPALHRAAQLLPLDAEAHANLGAALHNEGAWAEALVSLREALRLAPRNVEALIQAGDAQRALGRTREAATLYQGALQLDPRRVEAWNNLGNALLDLRQPKEAAGCYRRAHELQPDSAQVLGNLGNALLQLGELGEAVRYARQAVARAPTLSMAHNNLGVLLAAQGERAEAVTSLREALRLRPDYLDALNNLARILRELGQRDEVLTLYGRALELEPQRPEGYINLGYALFEVRRVTEAAASFRRALELKSDSAAALLGLATALRIQGLPAEAQASCEQAIALEPRNAEALALLGELYADRGRFAEARTQFERAIGVDADFAAGYAGIAALGRMRAEDADWLSGATALLDRPLPVAQQIHLRYALGKYFDDVGRYDEAFTHYHEANELSRKQGAIYDRARLEALVARVRNFCTPRFLSEPRPNASDSEQLVFIIGMPRSGTSLAEQILASHPQVVGVGEVRFWDKAFALMERSAAAGEPLEPALRRIAGDYIEQLPGPAASAARIVDKMPANFLYAGLIHAAFPRARFIHMRRHPLDTCLSIYFQHFFNVSPYANDLEGLAHYYGQYQHLSDYWRRVLPASTLLEVPYEELVADGDGWTRRIIEFTGLAWEPRCLEFHQTERVVITASRWQVRQKLHRGSSGRWRNYKKHLGTLLPLLQEPV